jgi:hypothetical protein
VSEHIDQNAYHALCTRAGGEVVNAKDIGE